MATFNLSFYNQEKARLVDGLCLFHSLLDGFQLGFLLRRAGSVLGSGKGGLLFCQAFGLAADKVDFPIHLVAIISIVEPLGASLGTLLWVFYCLKQVDIPALTLFVDTAIEHSMAGFQVIAVAAEPQLSEVENYSPGTRLILYHVLEGIRHGNFGLFPDCLVVFLGDAILAGIPATVLS
ncbi:hypothetical protein ES703_99800 [subsurface metagenome]